MKRATSHILYIWDDHKGLPCTLILHALGDPGMCHIPINAKQIPVDFDSVCDCWRDGNGKIIRWEDFVK